MKKLLLVFILSLYSLTSFGRGAILLELLFDGSKKSLKKILKGDVPLTTTVSKVEDDILTAVFGITGTKTPTPDVFLKAVNDLQVKDGDDVILQQELITLLGKEDPTAQDIIRAKNKMMILATNLGKIDKSTLIACSGVCKNAGLRFKNVTSPVISKAAKDAPTNPVEIRDEITQTLRGLGYQKLPRNVEKYFDEDQTQGYMRNFAIYLRLVKDKAQAAPGLKKVIESIDEFSKTGNGSIALIDPDNLHYFVREVVTGNYSDEELSALADIISAAAKESDDVTGRKIAFFGKLEAMAKGDPSRKDALQKLRAQNCFFKK